VQRLAQFVKRNIVDDVPEDIAVCEFDCRKGQCMMGEWAACNRRTRKASGELFPDSRRTEKP
jgi:curli biogenesis system outer membrane secretion channel CsgG